MNKILIVDSEKCAGCRSCELACAAAHHKTFDPGKARIHVLLNEKTCLSTPVVCMQCEDPAPCIEVCPVDALYRDEETNAVLCDDSKCVGCGLCAEECPIGAIKISKENKKVIKCDLCGGNPECIKVCPNNAITFVEATKENLKKKENQVELYKEIGLYKELAEEVE